jgi:hypothetical protein
VAFEFPTGPGFWCAVADCGHTQKVRSPQEPSNLITQTSRCRCKSLNLPVHVLTQTVKTFLSQARRRNTDSTQLLAIHTQRRPIRAHCQLRRQRRQPFLQQNNEGLSVCSSHPCSRLRPASGPQRNGGRFSAWLVRLALLWPLERLSARRCSAWRRCCITFPPKVSLHPFRASIHPEIPS